MPLRPVKVTRQKKSTEIGETLLLICYNKGMKAIPREAGRVTYSTEIRNLKKIGFNEYQRAVIIGSILGDGCLAENWSKTNYRMLIMHSVDQKEYILWKYSILKQWILSEPRFYKGNMSLTIRTISHPELTILRNIFYPKGKKIIPLNIIEYVENPLTIAIWFMDDGNAVIQNKKLCGYHINSQSFTHQENLLISKVLNDLYSIESTLEKNHGKFRIAIYRQNSRETFKRLIDPYMLESMRYKLG